MTGDLDMLNHHKMLALASAMAFVALPTPALAQDAAPTDAVPSSVYPDPYSPSWSDNDIALIAEQLTGFWSSSTGIENGRNEDGSVKTADIVIQIAPAPVIGLDDTFYVESAHAETPWAPYRQAVFQLYRYKGKVRLRTYEFAVGSDSIGVYTAMGSLPEYFPELNETQLIATMDVELEPTASGFTGASPYPYPTGAGGAVEMTSSITLDGDTLTTADRGYDATGNVVWGAGADGSYTFVRTESHSSVTKSDDGMAIIQIGTPGSPIAETGDQMHVQYSGYLSNGYRFDSSSVRGRPFVFAYPPGKGAIVGFGIGIDSMGLNGHRKFVIPGYLGYGERGNPRANIPADSTLLFDVHLEHIERPQPVPPALED